MPYLRMFDGENGVADIELNKPKLLLGRDGGAADIQIKHPTVSRAHAVIEKVNDHYFIEDAHSRHGTFIDCERINQKEILRHGSVVQLGETILEFRNDDEVRRKELEKIMNMQGIQRTLRMQFRKMPENVRVTYRTVSLRPEDIFATGDTLLVGDGGILISTREPSPEGTCIEVQITGPNGKARTFPGEVRMVLDDQDPPAMCIKLHDPKSKDVFQKELSESRRGSWKIAQKGQLPRK